MKTNQGLCLWTFLFWLEFSRKLLSKCLSSIVNEGIGAILNLFTFFFFLQDFTCTNSTKSIKSTKRKEATFLFLDVFFHIKNIKSTKRQTSDFLFLRCFYVHKNTVFFVFVHLYAFCSFCACEIFLQKKKKEV